MRAALCLDESAWPSKARGRYPRLGGEERRKDLLADCPAGCRDRCPSRSCEHVEPIAVDIDHESIRRRRWRARHSEQIQKHDLEQLRSATMGGRPSTWIGDLDAPRDPGRNQVDTVSRIGRRIGRRQLRLGRSRKQQEVLHKAFSVSIRATISLMTSRVAAVRRQAAADHLHGAANAGERILHLVRDRPPPSRRAAQRRLLAQLRPPSRRAAVRSCRMPVNLRLASDGHLAHRQMERKWRPVHAPGRDLATDADDALLAGRQVARQVAVVFFVVRLTASACSRCGPARRLRCIAEQPLGSRIERLDPAARDR